MRLNLFAIMVATSSCSGTLFSEEENVIRANNKVRIPPGASSSSSGLPIRFYDENTGETMVLPLDERGIFMGDKSMAFHPPPQPKCLSKPLATPGEDEESEEDDDKSSISSSSDESLSLGSGISMSLKAPRNKVRENEENDEEEEEEEDDGKSSSSSSSDDGDWDKSLSLESGVVWDIAHLGKIEIGSDSAKSITRTIVEVSGYLMTDDNTPTYVLIRLYMDEKSFEKEDDFFSEIVDNGEFDEDLNSRIEFVGDDVATASEIAADTRFNDAIAPLVIPRLFKSDDDIVYHLDDDLYTIAGTMYVSGDRVRFMVFDYASRDGSSNIKSFESIGSEFADASGIDVSLMKSLARGGLRAIKSIHDAGYIHGRIHSENLLVSRAAQDGGLSAPDDAELSVLLKDFSESVKVSQSSGRRRGGGKITTNFDDFDSICWLSINQLTGANPIDYVDDLFRFGESLIDLMDVGGIYLTAMRRAIENDDSCSFPKIRGCGSSTRRQETIAQKIASFKSRMDPVDIFGEYEWTLLLREYFAYLLTRVDQNHNLDYDYIADVVFRKIVYERIDIAPGAHVYGGETIGELILFKDVYNEAIDSRVMSAYQLDETATRREFIVKFELLVDFPHDHDDGGDDHGDHDGEDDRRQNIADTDSTSMTDENTFAITARAHAQEGIYKHILNIRYMSPLMSTRNPLVAGGDEVVDIPGNTRVRYMVMEKLGDSLDKVAPGSLNEGGLKDIAIQGIEGLRAIHSLGFVHGDIKPGNIAFTAEGGRDTIKFLDFGLSRKYEEDRVPVKGENPFVGGSKVILSPSELEGKFPERKDDMFRLGETILRLACPNYLHEVGEMLNRKRFADMLDFKTRYVPSQICGPSASFLDSYFETVRAMKYADAPNYEELIESLR